MGTGRCRYQGKKGVQRQKRVGGKSKTLEQELKTVGTTEERRGDRKRPHSKRTSTGKRERDTAGQQQRLIRDGGDKVGQVRGIHCVLPLAGSGKIPWLRLLMTEDLGESGFSCEDPVVLGEECCEEGLEELWRLWLE